MKRSAALTSVRNGAQFIERWAAYYGDQLGPENLFIMVDGHDQHVPDMPGVNVLVQDYVPRPRLKGDKFRAGRASDLAAELLDRYDLVIGTDIDEFLIVDPALETNLTDYLSASPINGALSAIGIDVARNARVEGPLDWSHPFLGQRQHGLISDRYTKANILSRPLRWGSGYHRVKGQRHKIDPNLSLFHFGSVDDVATQARMTDTDRVANGWAKHQQRRNAVPDEVSTAQVVEGDARFASAYAELSKPRDIIAWNKPRALKSDRVIRIPDRFHGLV